MADVLPFEPSIRPRRHVHKSGGKRTAKPAIAAFRQIALENLRKISGLTVYALARKSRTHCEVLKNILQCRVRARRATLARIEAALDGLIAERHDQVAKTLRRIEHGPVLRLDHTDSTRQRPRCRVWLEDTRCKMLATYIMHCEFGYPMPDLARALDQSRTAVGKTVKHYEDFRDKPRTERLIDAVRARLDWTR
jgi:hypothetical protein